MSLHRSPGGRCVVARQEAEKVVFGHFWSLLTPHIDAWTSIACAAAVLLWHNDQTYYSSRPSRGLTVDDALSFVRSSSWSSTITLAMHRFCRFRRSRPAPARPDRKRRRKWNTQPFYDPTQAVSAPAAHFACREVVRPVYAFHTLSNVSSRRFLDHVLTGP